jgi:hypothetical protein
VKALKSERTLIVAGVVIFLITPCAIEEINPIPALPANSAHNISKVKGWGITPSLSHILIAVKSLEQHDSVLSDSQSHCL